MLKRIATKSRLVPYVLVMLISNKRNFYLFISMLIFVVFDRDLFVFIYVKYKWFFW